jgi:biopolymer transport protein TolQ
LDAREALKAQPTEEAMTEVLKGALAPAAGGVSFLDLFVQAHLVVKFVMIGLFLASVWSWAIIIEKLFSFRRARLDAEHFEQQFWSGQSLEELYAALSPRPTIVMAALFVAAMREWKRSVEGSIRALGGIQLRVEKVMDVTISREMERLDRRLLFLATVGATAPFVGLFGTVWGIMTSFQAIAASKNTSLAVVAPGIAEALFATALGLLAAIPAVIFYNKFAADSARLGRGLRPSPTSFRPSCRVRSTLEPKGQGAMAAQLKTGLAGHGRRRHAKRHVPMSEINVTPFVDVMLVLLIVFMVSAPLLLSGIPVDLPASKGQSLSQDKDRLTITLDREGRVFVGSSEEPISVDRLVEILKANAKNGYNDQILFRGDRKLEYGRVSEVIGAVSSGGFKKFTFVSGPEDIEKGPVRRR